MKSIELNTKLIEYLPHLRERYDAEVSWQEGDNTGSHTVFGDVLTPYLVECILQDNRKEIVNIFNFLEDSLHLNDDYVDEVILLSVFESTAYLFNERTYLKGLLGKYSIESLEKVL